MRSDARKRLHPEPLPHWSPEVCELIRAAKAEAWDEGYMTRWNDAMRRDIPTRNPYRAEVTP